MPDEDNFLYQLTNWYKDKRVLNKVIAQLEKYDGKYMLKENNRGCWAVFVE